MYTKYILIALLCLMTFTTQAQNYVISGASSAGTKTLTTYSVTCDFDDAWVNPVWTVTSTYGKIKQTTVSTDRLTTTATIEWIYPGAATISVANQGGGVADTHNVTITCTPPVAPINTTSDQLFTPGTIYLSVAVNALSDYTVQWYSNSEGTGTALATGNTYSPSIAASTTYFAKVTDNTNTCVSATRPVFAELKSILVQSDIRSVQQESIRKEEIVEANLATMTEAQRTVSVSHLDGLGRVAQQTVVKASAGSLAKDIVQPIQYDAQGRSTKNYLPYVASTSTGEYHSASTTEQSSFYTAVNDKIANDNYPFSALKYEDSPLGRLVEQGTPGQAGQPGNGHSIRTVYSYNTGATANELEEVRKFDLDGSSSGFYAANLLQRIETLDENNNREIVFIDARGLIVARKKQLDESIDGIAVAYLQTYYIYDDFGRIRYIISPKGVSALKNANWVMTSAILDSYVYQFGYDYRGRIVLKKTPGQAWVYFVYDAMDRLVLVQDGLLRAVKMWSFSKYDNRGRVVQQGLYKNTTNLTRQSVQSLVDQLYTESNVDYPAAAWYEVRGSSLHGYTNISFPKVNADNSAIQVLAVNFYDSYDFDDADAAADYAYTSQNLPDEKVTSSANIYSVNTGSKRLVIGTSTWLYTYIFYDEYGRPVQTRSNNQLRTTVDNLLTVVYDFEGKVTSRKQYHNAGTGKVTTVVNKYTYDNQGRLRNVYQNNNNAATDQLVVQYDYNELGQLVDKKLHGITATTFLQSVDYRYTIGGQLESINNAQLAANSSNNDDADSNSEDYFGMELLYSTADASLGNTAAYDGNISAIKWKGIGAGAGTTDQRSYKYSFDKSGKLKTATSQMYTGSAWTKEAGTLNESIMYDQNGNIRSLQRNQRMYQLAGTTPSYTSDAIDNLSYTYSSSAGDQLLKVEDAAVSAGGFANGANLGTEYTYDVNGNVLTDSNKGISGIIYNAFGKAVTINFTDGRKIENVYDAAGNKLTMKTYAAGSTTPQTTTSYVDGFVYENNILSFFGSPEGRVVNSNGVLEYQYAIADHQGNTRVVFSSVTLAADAPMATLEGDANDGSSQYTINAANIVSFGSANHTTGGSKVVRMNQSYKTGPSKSVKVYPGDKIDIEVWEYHEGTSGFGTTSTPLNTLITNVAAAFGGVSGAAGESGAIYSGVNSGIVQYGTGGNQGDTRPAAYLNYILFDKNYNVLDAGWQLAPATTFTKQKISFPTKNIREEGYIYTWLSYDDDSNNWVYFDDFKVTHTKTNVIQYNDYYPFGLQASTSWTRGNNKNNYLYNEASELNTTSGWYETMYRGYDAALGRFMQIDPLAHVDHATSPFAYAGNNPILFNDPTGLLKATKEELFNFINEAFEGSGGTWSDDGGQQMFGSDQQAAIWALSNLGSLGGGINVNAESQLAGIASGGAVELRGVTITVDKNNNYHGEPYRNDTWLHTRLNETLVDPFDFTYALDDTQTMLDGVGLVPGAGEAADGLNAIIYLARGDKTNAALSAAAMIPIVGWAATVAKKAIKVEQYALRAAGDGFYPVMKRGFSKAQELVWLNKGDVWKFGTTKNPAIRYSLSYLNSVGEYGVYYSKEFSGTLGQALQVERMKIMNYLSQTGFLPAGNKMIK